MDLVKAHCTAAAIAIYAAGGSIARKSPGLSPGLVARTVHSACGSYYEQRKLLSHCLISFIMRCCFSAFVRAISVVLSGSVKIVGIMP